MSRDPHEAARQMLHWGRATLAPAERAALDAHLAACPECRTYQLELTARQVQLTRTRQVQLPRTLHAHLSHAHPPARPRLARYTSGGRVRPLLTATLQWTALLVLIVALAGTLQAYQAAAVAADRAAPVNRLAAPVAVGDRLVLTAAELSETTYAPGGVVDVTLHWSARLPSRLSYIVVLRLVDERGRAVAEFEAVPARGLYPTTRRRVGEEVADRYRLVVPARAAPGAYRLMVGLYDGGTGHFQYTDQKRQAITIAELRVAGGPPAESKRFEGWAGYSVESVALKPEAVMAASLYWQPDTAAAMKSGGAVYLVRAGDTPAQALARATLLTTTVNLSRMSWPGGDVEPRRFLLRLPDDLKSGTYQLIAALDGAPDADTVTLAVLDVP